MVERRIDEQLERHRWAFALAREERDRCGEVATGAGAADGEMIGIQVELEAMVCDPARCRVAVLESGGKRILRGSSVRDRDDRARRRVREPSADGVDSVDRSEHPASAEEVREDGQRTIGCGHIDTDGNLTARTGHNALEYAGDVLRRRRRGLGELRRACLGDGELVHRARSGGMSLETVRLDLGIERASSHVGTTLASPSSAHCRCAA